MAGELAPRARATVTFGDELPDAKTEPGPAAPAGGAPEAPAVPGAAPAKPVWSFKDLPAAPAGAGPATPAPSTAKPAAAAPAKAAWSFKDMQGGGAKPAPEDDLKKLGRIVGGRDSDVDYHTGAPWNIQLALARADNPEEAAAMLERRVGKDNYGQDQRGNWWIKDEGKKIAVRPSGGFVAGMKNLGTDTAAASPMLAGAMGGAAMGAPFGGPVGAVIGAGLGAAGGKVASEAEKVAEGTHRKTVAQEAGALGNEAAFNAAATGVGPVIAPVVRKAGDAFRGFVGATPYTKATTERLVADGAAPPLMSAAPDAKSAQYDQRMRNIVMGNPDEAKNTDYLLRRARDVLTSEGVPPAEAQAIMAEVTNQDARMSGSAVGKGIAQRAQGELAAHETELAAARTTAEQATTRATAELQAFADSQEGRLGEQVAQSISAARQEFGAEMSKAYAAVDRLAGTEPIVPISMFRNQARALRLVTPPNELPPLLGMLADADANIKLTFEQAHDLRTIFRDVARRSNTNLTPNLRAHRALTNANEAHAALESIADLGDNMLLSGVANDNGLPKAAVEALREVDRAYAEGIAKFHNARMNQLARDAKDGIYPDPNEVARLVLAPGHEEQTRTILSLLPQPVRDQVAKADAYNLIRKATDGTGKIDGLRLKQLLDDPARVAVMDQVYPPEVLNKARTLADELAALNGQLDVREIQQFSSGGVQQALETAVGKARDVDNFVKNNVMRALADPDPIVVDRAADALLSGGKEMHLEAVKRFLGENSPEWKGVQEYALKKVLRSAIVETPTLSKTIEGKAIDDAMANWSRAEQEMLFPNGLNEDLRELAKDAKFLFPSDMNDMGASLAAANIKSKVPFHIRADLQWAKYKAMGWLASHPNTLKFLADAHRANPETGNRLAQRVFRWAANVEDTGPGHGKPNPIIDQSINSATP